MTQVFRALLVVAGFQQCCFAQLPATEIPETPSPTWQAAGTVDGYNTHIYSLAFGPGSILVAGDAEWARVWDVAMKRELRFYKPTGDNTAAITGISYSPNDTWVSFRGLNEYHVAYANHGLKDGIPFNSGSGLKGRGNGQIQGPLAIGSDGKTYVMRSQSGKKNVLDVYRIDFEARPAVERRRLVSLSGHEDEPLCAAFSPDLKLLATGGRDKTVRLWDSVTGNQLAVLPGHTDAVAVVEFSPKGELIATGGNDGRLKFWNVATRAETATMQGKTAVKCLSFVPDGKLLASGDEEGLLRIVNVADAKTVAVMTDHVGTIFAVACSRDGNLIASAGQDKVIRLWKKSPEK